MNVRCSVAGWPRNVLLPTGTAKLNPHGQSTRYGPTGLTASVADRFQGEGMGGSAFGELLRDWRLSVGWTQDELAVRSGVSVHSISVLEAGRRQPRLSSVSQLADALALDPRRREQLLAAARPPPTMRDR
ncbi:helix-turn-helix transcriptional regulator, partial [Streptomyces sp. NPDC002764]|uniref:helix-turn-helix domain-containing protein n=1 Tax=Streptomyces sp. NPDC002764 TaxID=3154428 RepID=UPI00331DE4B5